MRPRNVVLLGLIFSALFLYVFFFERHQKASDDRDKKDLSVLHFQPQDVTGISLQADGRPSITLEKKDGLWSMAKPHVLSADAETIESLLSDLQYLMAIRVITPGKEGPLDLVQYGLANSPKKVTLTMGVASSPKQVLVIGARAPIGNALYASVEGNPNVVVISSESEKAWTKQPEDFRNRVVLDFDLDELEALELSNLEGRFDIVKAPHAAGAAAEISWQFKTPIKDKQLDQEALSNVLWELRKLKFKTYLGEQKDSTVHWEKPIIRLALSFNKTKGHRILIVNGRLPNGDYLAKMDDMPQLFTLQPYQVEPLTKTLSKAAIPTSQPSSPSKTP